MMNLSATLNASPETSPWPPAHHHPLLSIPQRSTSRRMAQLQAAVVEAELRLGWRPLWCDLDVLSRWKSARFMSCGSMWFIRIIGSFELYHIIPVQSNGEFLRIVLDHRLIFSGWLMMLGDGGYSTHRLIIRQWLSVILMNYQWWLTAIDYWPFSW